MGKANLVGCLVFVALFEATLAQTYIDIATSSTACNASTAGEYWFMGDASIETSRTSCLAENFQSSYIHTLVVIESLEEGNCLVRYIDNEFGDADTEWAIGLKDDQVVGVWEWDTLGDDPAGTTTTYEHWAPGNPKTAANRCAFFKVGESLADSGFWQDVACTTQMRAICERVPLPA